MSKNIHIDQVEELRKKALEDERYDKFIKNGITVGFTDDQIDFLWDFIGQFIKSND